MCISPRSAQVWSEYEAVVVFAVLETTQQMFYSSLSKYYICFTSVLQVYYTTLDTNLVWISTDVEFAVLGTTKQLFYSLSECSSGRHTVSHQSCEVALRADSTPIKCVANTEMCSVVCFVLIFSMWNCKNAGTILKA